MTVTASDCKCGHPAAQHDDTGRCSEWWRYPDVLNPRQCGCRTYRPDLRRRRD